MKAKLGRPKLLIVDDEAKIRSVLNELLEEEFEVELAANGLEAVSMAKRVLPDVILMDIIMPKLGGIEACAELRKEESTRHIPILMLTAMNATYDRIKAFNFGADDFISKPFDIEELTARIHSKLRRAREFGSVDTKKSEVGNLTLDLESRTVTVKGETIELPPVEFDLLRLLIHHEGKLLSRKVIMAEVWGNSSKSDRLMDAHLTALRKKIIKFNGEIQTVYGQGYRLVKAV